MKKAGLFIVVFLGFLLGMNVGFLILSLLTPEAESLAPVYAVTSLFVGFVLTINSRIF